MKRFSFYLLVSLLAFSFSIFVVFISFWERQTNIEAINIPVPENTIIPVELNPLTMAVEEYAVYSKVLDEYKTQTIFVYDYTTQGPTEDSRNFDPETSGLTSDTISDFKTKNESKLKLEYNFKRKGNVVLISDEESEQRQVNRKYPRILFSRIGFNQSRTQALLRVNFTCQVWCGNISLVLLQKENGIWLIRQKFILGES